MCGWGREQDYNCSGVAQWQSGGLLIHSLKVRVLPPEPERIKVMSYKKWVKITQAHSKNPFVRYIAHGKAYGRTDKEIVEEVKWELERNHESDCYIEVLDIEEVPDDVLMRELEVSHGRIEDLLAKIAYIEEELDVRPRHLGEGI